MKSKTAAASALCITLAFMTSACDTRTEGNIKYSRTETHNGLFRSTLKRLNDNVSLEMQELKTGKDLERLEFKCSDQSPVKSALARAVEENTKANEILSKAMENATLEKIEAVIPTLEKINLIKARLSALEAASNICSKITFD